LSKKDRVNNFVKKIKGSEILRKNYGEGQTFCAKKSGGGSEGLLKKSGGQRICIKK
jgi:hypothetical protein